MTSPVSIIKAVRIALHEVAPENRHVEVDYYHGCPDEAKAKSIMKNGISYQEVKDGKPRGKSQLAPVRGKVYITGNLGYAQIYALGGDMAGHNYPEQYWGGSPNGYVFVIDGKQLSDIEPDEDSIGEVLSISNPEISEYDEQFRRNLKGDVVFLQTVTNFVSGFATPRQLANARYGDIGAMAAIGKKAVRSMPIWMKIKLIDMGAHIAHNGTLIPTSCWKIFKGDSRKLARDGSNFFEVATRVA